MHKRPWHKPQNSGEVIVLAVELTREDREGRRIGSIFAVSDHEEVLKRSTNMILEPS